VLAAAYIPRETQESTLVWLLRTHLDAFIEQAERDSGPGLPGFVERQLRAMIDCGDLTRGFVRLECSSCRGPRIVPFSCKTRLCSSCAGRRMNEQACHLVDRVLPRAPYRQWVLTLPPELARRVAFDAELAGKVFGLFAAELARWQEETARAAGVDDPQAGSVMEVQRFADGARLWPHAHVLAPDGVFHEASDGSVRFVGHAAPCERDLVLVLTRLESRVLSYLKRLRPASDEDADESEDPAQLLLACSRTAAAADTASKPTASPRRRSRPRQRLCVRSETGFELHAEVRVPSHGRGALERLCRSMARPPIAEDRLVRREDGRVELRLKRAWKGGVRALVFEPVNLIARLAALIPLPYQHARKFFGVFAARHPLRDRVVPKPPTPTPERPVAPKRPGRMGWADLLRRVWNIDSLRCPWCGGRMYVVAAIRDPDAIAAIIASVHAARQRQAPARARPALAPRAPPPAQGSLRLL